MKKLSIILKKPEMTINMKLLKIDWNTVITNEDDPDIALKKKVC